MRIRRRPAVALLLIFLIHFAQPGRAHAVPHLGSRSAEQAVQDVEQVLDRRVGAGTVEKVRHRAEQVAEEIPRARNRGDVQMNGVEVHDQPEQVQVERAEHEIEDLAVRRRRCADEGDGHVLIRDLLHGSAGWRHSPVEDAVEGEAAVLIDESELSCACRPGRFSQGSA